MSKSEPDPKSRISILDSPEDITEKIKKSVTDFKSEVTYDPETRPGVSNLIMIHSLCTGESIQEICNKAVGVETGKYKFQVSEALVEYMKPIRGRMLELMEDKSYLLSVLKIGSEKAQELGQPVWDTVCHNVGISPQLSWLSKGALKVKSLNR